ncbi:MAG: chemotaxis protein CheD [Anaerolineaceae bacterium]
MGEGITSVGLGEIKISGGSGDVLVAFGLGSCVGIGIYDPKIHFGGLLHAVLPQSKNNSEAEAKYVDSGIKLLLSQMVENGAVPSRMIVRMVGGANMLTAPGLANSFDIGTRNIEAARGVLNTLRLPISAEEVGGSIGRTVRLYIADGRMTIRMMGGQEREIK